MWEIITIVASVVGVWAFASAYEWLVEAYYECEGLDK